MKKQHDTDVLAADPVLVVEGGRVLGKAALSTAVTQLSSRQEPQRGQQS